MRSTTFFIAALAVATGRVVAQDKTESTSTTTSTSASATDSAAAGIPKCVLDCTMRVASSTCGGVDLNCFCTNKEFQDQTALCIVQECNAEDQAASLNSQTEMCGSSENANGSTSNSGSSATVSASSARSSTASVVSASASGSPLNNAGTILKMSSASALALGATALSFLVGPLLFA